MYISGALPDHYTPSEVAAARFGWNVNPYKIAHRPDVCTEEEQR